MHTDNLWEHPFLVHACSDWKERAKAETRFVKNSRSNRIRLMRYAMRKVRGIHPLKLEEGKYDSWEVCDHICVYLLRNLPRHKLMDELPSGKYTAVQLVDMIDRKFPEWA